MSLFDKTERICPNCGAKVAAGNKYCEECGTLYQEVAEKRITKVKLYCPNGHEVDDTSYGFCLECGAKLVDTQPVKERAAATSHGYPRLEVQVSEKACHDCNKINSNEDRYHVECEIQNNKLKPAKETIKKDAEYKTSTEEDEHSLLYYVILFIISCGALIYLGYQLYSVFAEFFTNYTIIVAPK